MLAKIQSDYKRRALHEEILRHSKVSQFGRQWPVVLDRVVPSLISFYRSCPREPRHERVRDSAFKFGLLFFSETISLLVSRAYLFLSISYIFFGPIVNMPLNMPSSTEMPMSMSEQAHYVPTQGYATVPKHTSGRTIPSGLFTHLGADSEEDDGSDVVVVDAKLFNANTHDFPEGDFVCPGFFNMAKLDGFTRRFKFSQWNYGMRREAQFIFPFLALGPSSCLREREHLRSQGFTLLLGIRNTHSAHARLVSGDKAAADLGILADTVDVLDNQELISTFPRAIRRINDHLAGIDVAPSGISAMQIHSSQPRKVLVFCESGNERSAGVVIAYIMAMLNMDTAHAKAMAQQRRFCVSIDDPMAQILFSFESILAAKRDVERTRRANIQTGATTLAPPPIPPVMLAKKRSFADRQFEDTRMADCEMDVDDDVASLLDRKPVAPFQDRVI